MIIYCCECKKEVDANKVTGKEIYSHREELYNKIFFMCPTCNNFVGTHRKDKKPLGCIPTKELKKARKEIHKILDPIWKEHGVNRSGLYRLISNSLGYEYHTAEIRSIEEAREVYRIIQTIRKIKGIYHDGRK